MKFMLFFLICSQAFAADPTTRVRGKISNMSWNGESYKVSLNNFQTPITISGNNELVPCLENAQKSNMEVLVTIDSDIPMIKSCKLYTPGLINNEMQAQEEGPEKDSINTPIKSR